MLIFVSKKIWVCSNVARPLSYKAKTKNTYFFKTKTKTCQAKTKTKTKTNLRPLFWIPSNYQPKTTGAARNFDWKGPKLKKFLWRYFGDVFQWRNGNDVTEMTS